MVIQRMSDQELQDLLIKSTDDILKILSKRKLSALMDVGDCAIIFHRVLRRHFGDKAEEVKRYLLDKGYVVEETAYACPLCMHMIGRSNSDFDHYLKEDTFFCYSCDEEISPKNLLTDWILIRTDKPWGPED